MKRFVGMYDMFSIALSLSSIAPLRRCLQHRSTFRCNNDTEHAITPKALPQIQRIQYRSHAQRQEMESRPHGFTISKPQIILPPNEPKATSLPAPATNVPRPLSDIRELSEPSIIDNVALRPAKAIQSNLNPSRNTSTRSRGPPRRAGSLKAAPNSKAVHKRSQSAEIDSSSSYSSTPERSSFYSIPHSSVPRRSSSQNHVQRPIRAHIRKHSIRAVPAPSEPKYEGFTVPNHGPSRSPVKEAGSRLDAVNCDAGRRVPSRTYIRTTQATDILEFPSYRHPRVKLELQVTAPLFVGGGSVEGHVKITVDENERIRSRRSIGIGSISVDLLGFEDMHGTRKATFLAVGTELIDTTHPPPSNMVEPANPLAPDDKFWTLSPSTSSLPFMVSLPLDTGPPPFQSKSANIRFLLCATALIRDAGKHYRVRTSQEICVLATYDPEKALTSLPSPLTAADELSLRRFGRCESVTLTAGLHRQVWVSGSSIFVDVHIANKSHKAVKRLELYLERDILCYKHGPAGTKEKSASQARIFESNEQAMIARSSLKLGTQGWNGIEPHSSETRTCELELPRGHATVRCGKYFEVRFFLNVTASLSNTKLVSVQLPITLIHINSLDVLPNSVAQVAAAIEEKRAQNHHHHRTKSRQHARAHSRQRSHSSPIAMAELRRRPSNLQGRAFAAPRDQSIDRQRAAKTDIDHLRNALDSSPRKYRTQLQAGGLKKMGSTISVGGISLGGKKRTGAAPPPPFEYSPSPEQGLPITSTRARDENFPPTHQPMRRMQSADTMQSNLSFDTVRLKRGPGTTLKNQQNDSNNNSKGPPFNFTVVQHRIEPHVLGLSQHAAYAQHAPNGQYGEYAQHTDETLDPTARPDTGLSFREKMDRSRFEFKAVRRKASGGLSMRERGVGLWEQVRSRAREREREREGWI